MSTGRRVILHIGGEKTGSTTLQATLAANRRTLAEAGVLYSRVAGAENHVRLVLHATEGVGTRDLRPMAGLEDGAAFDDFLDSFADRLAEEAEASGATTLVYSNEHLSSRIRDAEGVRRLWSVLGPLADEIKLVYYARPQAELVVSSWSTMLKSGEARPFDVDALVRLGTPLDHLAVLERWGGFFADPYWLLRPYQPSALVSGDIVEDFLTSTGLPAVAVPRRLPPRNRSLDAVTAEFLRLYNTATGVGPGRQPAPARGPLIRLLEELSDGPGLRLPAEQEAAIAARFAEGNATVAQRLLGRETLFAPTEPGPAVLPDLSAEQAVRIAAAMWRVAQERPASA
jgi:hypothetical protein